MAPWDPPEVTLGPGPRPGPKVASGGSQDAIFDYFKAFPSPGSKAVPGSSQEEMLKHFQAQAQKSLQEAASKQACKQATNQTTHYPPASQPTNRPINYHGCPGTSRAGGASRSAYNFFQLEGRGPFVCRFSFVVVFRSAS